MSGYGLGDNSVTTSLKYGLNPAAKRKKKKPLKPLGGPIAAFAGGGDSSDEEDVPTGPSTHKSRGNLEVLRQQAAAKRDQKVRRGMQQRAGGGLNR
jgi:coiled-coil domain-containing protein 55